MNGQMGAWVEAWMDEFLVDGESILRLLKETHPSLCLLEVTIFTITYYGLWGSFPASFPILTRDHTMRQVVIPIY